jgi:hypothetical protein
MVLSVYHNHFLAINVHWVYIVKCYFGVYIKKVILGISYQMVDAEIRITLHILSPGMYSY